MVTVNPANDFLVKAVKEAAVAMQQPVPRLAVALIEKEQGKEYVVRLMDLSPPDSRHMQLVREGKASLETVPAEIERLLRCKSTGNEMVFLNAPTARGARQWILWDQKKHAPKEFDTGHEVRVEYRPM